MDAECPVGIPTWNVGTRRPTDPGPHGLRGIFTTWTQSVRLVFPLRPWAGDYSNRLPSFRDGRARC
jgi:hypothetical protein